MPTPALQLTSTTDAATFVEAFTRTNVPPLGNDFTHCKDLIAAEERNLAQLAAQIAESQTTLDGLRAAYGACRQRIDRFRGVFAPVRRIPPEIVSEIFAQYIPGSVSLPPRRGEMPFVLSQICSAWREIAHATPHLWSNVSLRLFIQRDNVQFLHRLQLWLDRASNIPLSLRISFTANSPHELFTSVLKQYAQRCSDLDLEIPFDMAYALLHLRVGALPKLKTLTLRDPDGNMWHSLLHWLDGASVTTFKDAPLLDTVVLSSTQSHYFNGCLQLPWSQLSTLYLEKTCIYTTEACRTLLVQCLKLTKCSLRFSSPAGSPGTIPITTLPQLVELSLIVKTERDFGEFFQHFTLPSLTDLSLAVNINSKPNSVFFSWPSTIFTQFMNRSQPIIRRLTFRDIKISSLHLIALLMEQPMLYELSLTHCSQAINTLLVNALAYDGGGAAPLAPTLEMLTLRGSGKYLRDGDLARLIGSRWWQDDKVQRPVSRLRAVVLELTDLVDTESKARLEQCRAEGLLRL